MSSLKKASCLLLALLLFAAPLLELPVLAVDSTVFFTEGVYCEKKPVYSSSVPILGVELAEGGEVPPGMSWSWTEGETEITLSGTPTAAGTCRFTLLVRTEMEELPVNVTAMVESAVPPEPVHEHSFGGWVSDASGHWTECTCGEKSGFSGHSVTDWVTVRPSTATEQGERQGQCSVCGFTVTEPLPLHVHSFSSAWQSDGSGHWHVCDCGEKSDLSAHSVTNWITIRPSTATEQGERQGQCSVCGFTVVEALPLHVHSFSGAWQSDASSHWHICDCGEKNSLSSHSVTDWTVTKTPTASEMGQRQGRCSVCGCTVTEALPLHVHSFSSAWQHDASAHWRVCGCGEKGDYAGHTVTNWTVTKKSTTSEQGQRQGKCSVCGYTVTEALPLHTHVFSGSWKNNASSHWHVCECGEKGDLAAHTVGSWTITKESTTTTAGERQGKCSICGYTVTEALPLHVHSFSSAWKSDNDSHWHICDCGEKGSKAKHTVSVWVETKAATTEKGGERQGYCTVCNALVTESTPVHTHSFDKTHWESDKENHWNVCDCGEKLNIAAHTVRESDWTITKAATTENEGERKGKCSVCSAVIIEAVPKLALPSVTKQPTAETMDVGGRAVFIARADNADSISWRFISADNSKTVEYSSAANYFTGLTVIGGSTDTLTISTVPYALNGWKAVCRFRNKNGETLSDSALITVRKAASQLPIITLQPKPVSAHSGESVTLSVRALSPDGGKLIYQWYRSPDGTTGSSLPISGATEATYIPEQRIGDCYYCVSIRSENATIQSDTLFSDLVCVTYSDEPLPTPEPVHIHVYDEEWHSDEEEHFHLCECGEQGSRSAHVFEWTETRKAGKKSLGLRTGKCVVCGYEKREEIPATGTGRRGLLTFILILLAILVLAAAGLVILKATGHLSTEDEDEDGGDDEPDGPDTTPEDYDEDEYFSEDAPLNALFAAEAAKEAMEEADEKSEEERPDLLSRDPADVLAAAAAEAEIAASLFPETDALSGEAAVGEAPAEEPDSPEPVPEESLPAPEEPAAAVSAAEIAEDPAKAEEKPDVFGFGETSGGAYAAPLGDIVSFFSGELSENSDDAPEDEN